MWYLILSIVALGIATAVFGYAGGKRKKPAASASPSPACCGQHEFCERNSLIAAANRRIEYYDDDELDRFNETAADAYSDAAIEEFREVLYTLRTTEVAGWLRSLQLRRINLPDALKDEAYLIVGEQRTQN
jgi:hypothetical protein